MESIFNPERSHSSERPEDAFLPLFEIALSDRRLEPAELNLLYQMAVRNGVQEDSIDSILANPQSTLPDLPSDGTERIRHLYSLARMMHDDGHFDDAERRTTEKLCVAFGFLEENAPDITSYLSEQAAQKALVEEVLADVGASM